MKFFNNNYEYIEIKFLNENLTIPPKNNCILLEYFWERIKIFNLDDKNFDYLCQHGLKKSVNKESLIAIYIPYLETKKIIYHDFPKIKHDKYLVGVKTMYDILQYIEGIPDEFSIFYTTSEAGKVRKYQNKLKKLDEKKKFEKQGIIINKEKLIKKEKTNNGIKEFLEPIPDNSHQYCHIYKCDFDGYIKHIKSDVHEENKKNLNSIIDNIQLSFERINDFCNIKLGREIKRIKNKKINLGETKNNKNNSSSSNLNSLITRDEEISKKEGSINYNNIILSKDITTLITNTNHIKNINNKNNKNKNKNSKKKKKSSENKKDFNLIKKNKKCFTENKRRI